MAKEEIYTIEIRNWEKFQHHNGKRTYDWFKVSSNIFDDAEIRNLSDLQLCVWFQLLALAARYRQGTVKVTLRYLRRTPDVPLTYLRRALTKLAEFRMVTIILGTTEENRVEEKRKETTIAQTKPDDVKNTDEPLAQATPARLNFDFIYSKYPRKAGKSRGHSKLKATVKTTEVFNSLSTAVDNYARYCRVHRTETQFIKHWSTFVGEWNDWVSPDPSIFKTGQSSDFFEERIRLAKLEEEKNATLGFFNPDAPA